MYSVGQSLFTSLDATKGYWQVPFDHDSQILMTFITTLRRYKFLQAPMGSASSQGEYCVRGDKALQSVARVVKVIGDFLTYSTSAQGHVNSVAQVLNRCRTHGIIGNPD